MEERKFLMMWGMQLERTMCQATVKLCLGLERAGRLVPPAAPFNTAEQRYNQRFGVFAQIYKPEPVSYEQYQTAVGEPGIPTLNYLQLASEAYIRVLSDMAAVANSPTAKHLRPEQVKHLAGVKRVATTNCMALNILMKALEGGKGGNAAPSEEEVRARAAGFVVNWDLKVALQHGAAFFYPCLSLKSSAS